MAHRILRTALIAVVALAACGGDDDPTLLTAREPTAAATADTQCWVENNHDPDCLTTDGALRDKTLDDADQVMLTGVTEPLTADGERAVRTAIDTMCLEGLTDDVAATFDEYGVTPAGRDELEKILVEPFCPRD